MLNNYMVQPAENKTRRWRKSEVHEMLLCLTGATTSVINLSTLN